jgi:hypothetical protein
MKSLQTLMEGYQPADPPQVRRSGDSYQQTYDFIHSEIQRLKEMYAQQKTHGQTSRLIRDMIDVLLRRYHKYSIQQNLGAHYREVGLSQNAKTEFEHIMPAKVARDAVLTDRLTIDQAMHIPTCTLSKTKHQELASRGLAKTTPDPYWFWRRYKEIGVKIETRDGTTVDLDTWNLDSHFAHFSGQS